MGDQEGTFFIAEPASIATPDNATKLTLFRDLSDSLYYVKKSDGTIELFSAGIIIPLTLFQKVGSVNNVGAGEDNLYSNAIPANTLAINGDSISAKYTVRMANTLNAKVIRFYFGTVKIFESTNDYSTGTQFDLDINVNIMRIDANTVRTTISYVANGITESQYSEVSPLDFTTALDLQLTGEGVANSDITALYAKGVYIPHA